MIRMCGRAHGTTATRTRADAPGIQRDEEMGRMTSQVAGEIDINPPLQWSEVAPTGFMVMNNKGEPKAPNGRRVALVATEELIDRAEGTMHKYTFASIAATAPDIPDAEKETFRAQLAAVIAAFPTHTFGGVNRTIRFRGDLLDDQWRVRLDNDGVTVRRQTATLTWTDV